MQVAVFVVLMCAVLNNEIHYDRCELAPGYGPPGPTIYFATADECWAARTEVAFIFGGIPREKSSHREFIQWATRQIPNNPTPFNLTVTCAEDGLPAFRPLPLAP
jgi:hypothetical protein